MPDIDMDELGQTQLLDLLHRLQTEEGVLEKVCSNLQTEATSLGREVELVLTDGNGETSRKQAEEVSTQALMKTSYTRHVSRRSGYRHNGYIHY